MAVPGPRRCPTRHPQRARQSLGRVGTRGLGGRRPPCPRPPPGELGTAKERYDDLAATSIVGLAVAIAAEQGVLAPWLDAEGREAAAIVPLAGLIPHKSAPPEVDALYVRRHQERLMGNFEDPPGNTFPERIAGTKSLTYRTEHSGSEALQLARTVGTTPDFLEDRLRLVIDRGHATAQGRVLLALAHTELANIDRFQYWLAELLRRSGADGRPNQHAIQAQALRAMLTGTPRTPWLRSRWPAIGSRATTCRSSTNSCSRRSGTTSTPPRGSGASRASRPSRTGWPTRGGSSSAHAKVSSQGPVRRRRVGCRSASSGLGGRTSFDTAAFRDLQRVGHCPLTGTAPAAGRRRRPPMAVTTTRTPLSRRAPREARAATVHRVPVCPTTGHARYRDRQQARHAIRACGGRASMEVQAFACSACAGFHIEPTQTAQPIRLAPVTDVVTARTDEFRVAHMTRTRRFFLVDIENLTDGARGTDDQIRNAWRVLRDEAPGIAPADDVLIGAAERVARRLEPLIQGRNVRWVVGEQIADGADLALLEAIDLDAVATRFDELVIVSGDHAFAPLARRARLLGLSVQVVTTEAIAGRHVLAQNLASVANTHTVIRRTSRSEAAARRAARVAAASMMARALAA